MKKLHRVKLRTRSLFLSMLLGLVIQTSLVAETPTPSAAPSSTPAASPAASPSPTPATATEEKKEATTQTAGSERWAGKKSAISLGLTPVFTPKFASADRFNSGNLMAFDLTFAFDPRSTIGLRYGKGTIPSLYTYDSTTFVTTTSANASYTLIEFFAGLQVPLNEPYTSTGPVQFFVPVNFGLGMISVSGGPTSFMGIGFDTSAGIGARVYTHSFFRFDVSALYHLGFPIGEFVSSAATTTIQAKTGENMKISFTGIEVRLGISILFPDAPEGESK